jgi:hypothetical protein
VLTHAFVPRFEQDDASGVPDGSEADGFESGVHETTMFETIAAAVPVTILACRLSGSRRMGRPRRTSKLSKGMLAIWARRIPARVS